MKSALNAGIRRASVVLPTPGGPTDHGMGFPSAAPPQRLAFAEEVALPTCRRRFRPQALRESTWRRRFVEQVAEEVIEIDDYVDDYHPVN